MYMVHILVRYRMSFNLDLLFAEGRVGLMKDLFFPILSWFFKFIGCAAFTVLFIKHEAFYDNLKIFYLLMI